MQFAKQPNVFKISEQELSSVRRCRAAMASTSILRRLFSTASAHSPSTASLFEIRTYTLHPSGIKPFLKLTAQSAELRSLLNPGFRGFFSRDTGGALNQVTHFYAFNDMADRARIRQALAQSALWQQYIDASRPFVAHQESSMFLEAADCMAAAGASPANLFASPLPLPAEPATYELRTYQLSLGYSSVPLLQKAFVEGLPAKVKADKTGRLALMAYSDVGALNTFIELWRYPNAAACIEARQASRLEAEWRACVGKIAPMVLSFRTEFLNPEPFSPWK
jgi:hypothetical protein